MFTTPLHERHAALGAKFADFSGWQMPIEYSGQGVLREHRAVRDRVGLFDVSHLGKVTVTGPGAAALVDACLTNALARIGPGRAQYSLCCAEDGGVVDDLILYLRTESDLLLVPNAANAAEVARRLSGEAPAGVTVADRHRAYGVLAVQGPAADDVLDAVGLPVGHDYMAFAEATWTPGGGASVTVCRTGYTGEHGYEVILPWDNVPAAWDVLLAEVGRAGGLACGLGARDTLRTEMGYPLHGHELGPQITPVQARVGWAVGWGKPAFWGRDALLAERARGPQRVARGLVALDRGIPRPGMGVTDVAGRPVGTTTSGTFSPTRRVGIALALLAPEVGDGTEVRVDVRGKTVRCSVTKPPFVRAQTR